MKQLRDQRLEGGGPVEQGYDVRKMVPLRRSLLRRRLGMAWYSTRRYLLWVSGKYRFAGERQRRDLFPFQAASHATPLLRQLRDVDMQYQYNKVTNLRLAAERVDGLVLRPGETMSFWRCVGKPSRRKGYLDGLVLYCGQIRYAVGGGLCQMSNLLFWMTLHTPLTVVERYRHSHDVFPDSGRTQPFGSGATCAYPHRDLMIRNDTEEIFQLRLRVGQENLEGRWLCENSPAFRYRIVERDHEFRPEYFGGYSRHNKLYRQVMDPEGTLLYEELVVVNHALTMYSPLLEGQDGVETE